MVIGKCHTFHLFVSPIVPSFLLSLSVKIHDEDDPQGFFTGHWFRIKTSDMVDFELMNRCVFSTDFCRYPMFFVFFPDILWVWQLNIWGIAMYRHASPVSVSMEPYLAGQDW